MKLPIPGDEPVTQGGIIIPLTYGGWLRVEANGSHQNIQNTGIHFYNEKGVELPSRYMSLTPSAARKMGEALKKCATTGETWCGW